MTADEARAIIAAQEECERTLWNLRNIVEQHIDVANPEYEQHQRKVASAGDAYARAQTALDQLLMGHLRGVEAPLPPIEPDASLRGARGETEAEKAGERV